MVRFIVSGAVYDHEIVQQWLNDEGVARPRIEGGCKALRQHLIQRTQELVSEFNWIVVSGRTAVRKQSLLRISRTQLT